MSKASSQVIVKSWEHYNRALDVNITSKKHYFETLRKQGCCTWKEGERLVAEAKRKKKKEYTVSKEALEVMQTARQSADFKGNIRPDEKLIDGMQKVGVRFYSSPYVPKEFKEKGGFSADKEA